MLLPAFISHVHAAREGLKLGPESGLYGFHHTTLLLKVAQIVKILPAMQETRLRSLGWEDSLEKEMAIHSSILAWRISWRLVCSHKESDMTERLNSNNFPRNFTL